MAAQKRNAPWLPAEYEVADLKAVQMVQAGEADATQQKRALDWIVRQVCGTYDLTYFPDSSRDSDFAQGKRFVGLQIVKALHVNTAVLAKKGE